MMETGNTGVMTLPEAAAYLRLSVPTVYRLLAEEGQGGLPAKRIGKRWRFRRDELEAFASGVVRSDDSGEGVQSATGNVRKN